MPNTVGIKLEAALKAYIAANYQESGDPLLGAEILLGKTPDNIEKASYLIIAAGAAGGDLAQQGNYEIPVTFIVATDFDNPDGTETADTLRLKHGQRADALRGIFGNDRTLTVRSALMAIDLELGVSSYWHGSETEDFQETQAITTLLFTFEAYLAP